MPALATVLTRISVLNGHTSYRTNYRAASSSLSHVPHSVMKRFSVKLTEHFGDVKSDKTCGQNKRTNMDRCLEWKIRHTSKLTVRRDKRRRLRPTYFCP